MIERRRFLRIKENDAINYMEIPQHKSTRMVMKDISLVGIRFISDHFIPLHTLLKVEIKLKHAVKLINAIVRLKWIRSVSGDEYYEAGAEFVDIKKEDLKLLEHYHTLYS